MYPGRGAGHGHVKTLPGSPPDSLAAVCEEACRRLAAAVTDRGSPFRTPVLSTMGADGPEGRTVVLRTVTGNLQSLHFYSDARAAKIEDIANEPRISLVFYDPSDGVQVRLNGRAQVHQNDAVSAAAWAELPAAALGEYLSASPPGSAAGESEDSLDADTGRARTFAVIELMTQRMDWLRLSASGHLRARFERIDGDWIGQWIVP